MALSPDATAAGRFSLGGDLPVARMGYGAMRLAGPGVMGPPADRSTAMSVLRQAVEHGVNHIDTSDYYGPSIVNEIIRDALHPYPEDLVIVTKVGARRTEDGGWPVTLSTPELVSAVHDNLGRLDLDRLDVVNLRISGADGLPPSGSIAEPFAALVELQREGLIHHVGLSNVTAAQLDEARAIAPVACVQNEYNLVQRTDDPLVDRCQELGIAFVPFFPLGGFAPLQSERLATVASRLDATPMQVALAWLLQRSPAMLCIPGTSSPEHLVENVAAVDLRLSPDDLGVLDDLAGG